MVARLVEIDARGRAVWIQSTMVGTQIGIRASSNYCSCLEHCEHLVANEARVGALSLPDAASAKSCLG